MTMRLRICFPFVTLKSITVVPGRDNIQRNNQLYQAAVIISPEQWLLNKADYI